jgi:hypothetical protein
MEKIIFCPISWSSYEIEGITFLNIEMDFATAKEFCLGLSLLIENLCEGLKIISNNKTKFKFGLKKDLNNKLNNRVEIIKLNSNQIEIVISQYELGYWHQFFLKNYRSGAIEVDHIDVEIPKNKIYGEIIITIKLVESFTD